MSNASAPRNELPVEPVDPLLLVAAGIGLVALALFGVGVYASMVAFGVSFQPSGLLFVTAVSLVMVLAVVTVTVYGCHLNGRSRPEVNYHR